MMRFGLIIAWVATLAAVSARAAAPAAFFAQHCTDCHDAETKKGGLDLTALTLKLDDRTN